LHAAWGSQAPQPCRWKVCRLPEDRSSSHTRSPVRRAGVDLSQRPVSPACDFSIERRWSSRRFPYGYLVTTSSQLPASP